MISKKDKFKKYKESGYNVANRKPGRVTTIMKKPKVSNKTKTIEEGDKD